MRSVSQPELETETTQQAGRNMAVLRGWREQSPSEILGSFIDNVLFPSSGTSECKEGRRYGAHWLILQALEKSERQPE